MPNQNYILDCCVMIMLTDIEQKVIACIQGDLPVTEKPYLEIAEKLGQSEDTILKILKKLSDQGIMRRFGATLRHQKSGYKANAMVAWQVDEVRIEEIGRIMASFQEVSHCYRRNPSKDWPYNLYTMVHAKNRNACHDTAKNMAEKASVSNYTLLFSKRELKKTSMKYFSAS
jgi:DNA-binding Lrp family transcriptional regulator